MKFRRLSLLFLVSSCGINTPKANLPTGSFNIASDCPGAVATGTENVTVNNETSILSVSNATQYGFPKDQIGISSGPDQYKLEVTSEGVECSAYWRSGASNNYVFICKSDGVVLCSIKLSR